MENRHLRAVPPPPPPSGGGKTSRRVFLGALVAAATGGAYVLGARLLPGAQELDEPPAQAKGVPTATPAPPQPTVTPEPEIQQVQEFYPGAPGKRTRKNLPPLRLVAPSIALDTTVVPIAYKYDGRGQLAWETAEFVAGHYINTANPGEPGNCIISGHISSPRSGAIFHRLPDLKPGAGVAVGTAESMFLYEVADARVVPPGVTEVMEQGTGSKLTLITCVPDLIYSHRLIVTALPV